MHNYDSMTISKNELLELAEKMKSEGRRLLIINGYVDKEENNVVVYHFDIEGDIKTFILRGCKEIPSLINIYGVSARWCEEEICEMMPIKFEGLNNCNRLFLPEEFDGSGQILVMPLSELKKHNKEEIK